MIRLSVRASTGSYGVLVGPGLLTCAGQHLREAGLAGRVRLVADSNVFNLYGQELASALAREGFRVAAYQVPPGETSKTLAMAARIYDWLIEVGAERRDLVVALGGGVVGDLAGFVAATYLRGLPLVQVPTSLLAQVDSSVGGKVAVNHTRGKNLIGAFYPPSLVLADTDTLGSLPEGELSAALAEVAKMAVILDATLLERLERQADALFGREAGVLDGIVARSIELKAQVVQEDEKETGLRAILNYGHTIGHAIEAVTGYGRYRHGEAVAIGMAGAAAIAARLGIAEAGLAGRQSALLGRLGLPLGCPGLSADELLEAMGRDKKASLGRLTWVLPERVGRVTLRRDVPTAIVLEALQSLVKGEAQ